MKSGSRDERVAPNIFRTPHGWRVYVKRDGVLKPKRFPHETPLSELQAFIDGFKQETERIQEERQRLTQERQGTFAADAAKYLDLKVVRALVSYSDRRREIRKWIDAFGKQPRATITPRAIDEQLQAWFDAGAAPASVNKYRAALMALYTRLDGRGAANPVRQTRLFEEPAAVARGLSYRIVRLLLDAMPEHQSRPEKGVKGSRSKGSKTRVRFELMAWTGMTPQQIKELTPRHINLKERWYVAPQRHKGQRRKGTRAEVRKPMTADARRAFARFLELKAWGTFDTRALRHSLERARVKVERQLRKERRDKTFTLPHVRPYDFRHSFGTELYRRTGDLGLVSEMLDHSSLAMTKRYALGAVPEVLRAGMKRFEQGAGRRRG